MNRSLHRLLGLMLVATWFLSGCAGGYLLDNTVTSFSGLTAAPGSLTYRFDRLPSQQVPAQAQLEAMADPALHEAGLRRDDANPRYTVQVSGAVQPLLSPWADPWRFGPWPDPWRFGAWGGYWRHGFGVRGGLGRWEEYWYRRAASVIVRELPGNSVVYETHAHNDGPWLDHTAVFPAMFKAALQGFPTPPPGPRRIDVQIGG